MIFSNLVESSKKRKGKDLATSGATFSRFELISPATRGDYRKLVAPLASVCWPEFMLHDPVAERNWDELFERFPDYQFGIYDNENRQPVAMGNSLPMNWTGGMDDLPDKGWDWAFEHAVNNDTAHISPNIQCAIQIAIQPAYQRQGLSAKLIQNMRQIGKEKGFLNLIAPVRPNQKAQYPLTNIDDYVSWKTEQGLPFDAWLRVHSRLGATIIKVCHQSMTIQGTLSDWEAWTRLQFPASGGYIIQGALNPISIDLEKDQGTYIEPNVWMIHDLT